MQCCFTPCSDKTIEVSNDCRASVKSNIPSSFKEKSNIVTWSKQGEAVFHRPCWDIVLKASRCRRKKKRLGMPTVEKQMIKEAAKSAEFFGSTSSIQEAATKIADMIRASSHAVTFTGAGISTAAGIGDYRGKSGKWTEEDRSLDHCSGENGEPNAKRAKTEVDEEGKVKDGSTENEEDKEEDGGIEGQEDVEQEEDGVPYERLRPTYTHEALAALVQRGHVKHIISQNGDGLHGLSGVPAERLSELHGNVFVEKCSRCHRRFNRPYYVMDDAASQYYEELEDHGETSVKKPHHAVQCSLCGLCHHTGRRCKAKKCGGPLLDTIINFRDHLESEVLETATREAEGSDLMLCLGTTLVVTPACDLVEMTKRPRRLVIVNRQPTPLDDLCSVRDQSGQPLGVRVFGDCDDVMKIVMASLMTSPDVINWEKGRVERLRGYDLQRQNPS